MSENREQRYSGNNNNHRGRYNNNNNNNNGGGNRYNNSNTAKHDGPKREAILDLNKYKDQQIRVKFIGGRQISGTLKGFDQLMNLVLEDVSESIRDPEDEAVLTGKTRQLGLVVVRCTSLLTISPVDGSETIENPFVAEE